MRSIAEEEAETTDLAQGVCVELLVALLGLLAGSVGLGDLALVEAGQKVPGGDEKEGTGWAGAADLRAVSSKRISGIC